MMITLPAAAMSVFGSGQHNLQIFNDEGTSECTFTILGKLTSMRIDGIGYSSRENMTWSQWIADPLSQGFRDAHGEALSAWRADGDSRIVGSNPEYVIASSAEAVKIGDSWQSPAIVRPADAMNDGWDYWCVKSQRSLITFSIDGFIFQGVEDMSWAAWSVSEYNNVSGFGILNGVMAYSDRAVLDENLAVMLASWKIRQTHYTIS